MTSSAATTSDVSTSGVSQKKPWYKVLYFQVLVAIVLGVLVGWLFPDSRKRWIKAARRRLHQAGQDDDRADHLLHRGHGIAHIERRQEGRPRRRQGAVYFEVVSTFALVDRPDRRQCRAARRRLQHRSGHARSSAVAELRRPGAKRTEPSTSSCTSSPTRSSAPSPRATSCRCCCSPSCSASRCMRAGRARPTRCATLHRRPSHVVLRHHRASS